MRMPCRRISPHASPGPSPASPASQRASLPLPGKPAPPHPHPSPCPTPGNRTVPQLHASGSTVSWVPAKHSHVVLSLYISSPLRHPEPPHLSPSLICYLQGPPRLTPLHALYSEKAEFSPFFEIMFSQDWRTLRTLPVGCVMTQHAPCEAPLASRCTNHNLTLAMGAPFILCSYFQLLSPLDCPDQSTALRTRLTMPRVSSNVVPSTLLPSVLTT